MNALTSTRFWLILLVILTLTPVSCLALVQSTSGEDEHKIDPKWLERMDREDRAPLHENIGYAPPEITDDLQWPDAKPLSWKTLRGKVVVIQSWTSKTSAGRAHLRRIEKTLEDFAKEQVQIIALHTPEKAENAAKYLQRRRPPFPVVIDPVGRFCDEFGMYRQPTNVVLGRNGRVRYAGLNVRGLREAVALLLEEPLDESITPQPRPGVEVEKSQATFPPFEGSVGSARDLRGRRGPDLFVQQWVNGKPSARGRVVLVEFWGTWCGPCVRNIPHMNQLADRFRDEVVIIGISFEPMGTLRNFMRTTEMRYFVASDTTMQGSTRMHSAVGKPPWPHALVLSSDWVVRWQGHPAKLTQATLTRIVEANRALQQTGRRYRWSGAG